MRLTSENYQNFSRFIIVLVAISATSAFGFHIVIDKLIPDFPFWPQLFLVDIPSTSVFFWLFFNLFDKYGWKWKFFRTIKIVDGPDLSGNWEGTFKSSFNNFTKEYPVTMTIAQTATKIEIHAKFNQSRSGSLTASFEKSNIDGTTALFFFYQNRPNADALETMAMHEGACMLVFDPTTNLLAGNYYSGRNRHNHGDITLRKIQ